VAAAADLFSRYGVKRTSMSSVAEAAGVSRQTLYALFENKDELIAAAMSAVIDEIVIDLVDDWQSCQSVDDIVTVYYKHSVYKPFEMLMKSPDLKDLLHGVGEHTTQIAKNAEKMKTKLLAEQFAVFQTELAKKGTSAEALANFIVRTTTELKFSAQTKKELDKLLETLRHAIEALTGN